MAWRLKLVPDKTSIDFFALQWVTFGASVVAVIASLVLALTLGLNFGIDFRGGTTIRTESTVPVDVGAYRQALAALDLGDTTISEVFDPGFRADQYVSQIRIEAQDGAEAVSPEVIAQMEAALRAVDPAITFPSVESVGPKVSGELIWQALFAVAAGALGILAYVWVRFEWQFAVGTVAALIHDVIVTVGVFALFQIKFDLTIVAALLTILGYSVNDTVVVFDRIRENFRKTRIADVAAQGQGLGQRVRHSDAFSGPVALARHHNVGAPRQGAEARVDSVMHDRDAVRVDPEMMGRRLACVLGWTDDEPRFPQSPRDQELEPRAHVRRVIPRRRERRPASRPRSSPPRGAGRRSVPARRVPVPPSPRRHTPRTA